MPEFLKPSTNSVSYGGTNGFEATILHAFAAEPLQLVDVFVRLAMASLLGFAVAWV